VTRDPWLLLRLGRGLGLRRLKLDVAALDAESPHLAFLRPFENGLWRAHFSAAMTTVFSV